MVRRKIDWKIVQDGLIAFVIMSVVASVAHEGGHILACTVEGYEWEVDIIESLTGTPSMYCLRTTPNTILFLSSGGIAGVAASLAPIAIFGRRKFLLIGCLPMTFANSITGTMGMIATKEPQFWYVIAKNKGLSRRHIHSFILGIISGGFGGFLVLKQIVQPIQAYEILIAVLLCYFCIYFMTRASELYARLLEQ